MLYGTTTSGGNPNRGTVFSLSTDGIQSVLLHNSGTAATAWCPITVVWSPTKKGDLFGTTSAGGGSAGNGIVFELSPPGAGKTVWKETVLHSFGALGSDDVASPFQGVVLGAGGVVYGCAGVGKVGMGAVYAVTPPPKGSKKWMETILYDFGTQTNDPAVTECALTLGPGGKLYGAASSGGAYNWGALFELDPPSGGATKWTETVLHSFGPIRFRGRKAADVRARPARQNICMASPISAASRRRVRCIGSSSDPPPAGIVGRALAAPPDCAFQIPTR